MTLALDTLTVREPVKASTDPRLATLALLATLAPEPVADPAYGADVEHVAVVADSQRLDFEQVEHTRQSRLQRWQRLP